jgi:hypothetical protein
MSGVKRVTGEISRGNVFMNAIAREKKYSEPNIGLIIL